MRMNFEEAQKRGLLGHINVFLDGEEVEQCIEFDEEKGYVVFQHEGRERRDLP